MAKLQFTVVLLGNSDFREIFEVFNIWEIRNSDSVIFRLSQGAKYFVPSDYGM